MTGVSVQKAEGKKIELSSHSSNSKTKNAESFLDVLNAKIKVVHRSDKTTAEKTSNQTQNVCDSTKEKDSHDVDGQQVNSVVVFANIENPQVCEAEISLNMVSENTELNIQKIQGENDGSSLPIVQNRGTTAQNHVMQWTHGQQKTLLEEGKNGLSLGAPISEKQQTVPEILSEQTQVIIEIEKAMPAEAQTAVLQSGSIFGEQSLQGVSEHGMNIVAANLQQSNGELVLETQNKSVGKITQEGALASNQPMIEVESPVKISVSANPAQSENKDMPHEGFKESLIENITSKEPIQTNHSLNTDKNLAQNHDEIKQHNILFKDLKDSVSDEKAPESSKSVANTAQAPLMAGIFSGKENVITTTINSEVTVNQVTNIVVDMAKSETQKLTLELSPQELGKITVEMEYIAGKVALKINAENASTTKILSEHIAQLKLSLEANNLDVVKVDVQNNTGFDQSFANLSRSFDQSFNSQDANPYLREDFDTRDSGGKILDEQPLENTQSTAYYHRNQLLNYLA
ncbi:MAG: Flagellar hook-length control protein [Oscillospiraceae bacterium]|jgi:flagellar hook-length control protein FliK|nr:Flagellar hook-length control protein [Oscillospiraceae bacterium]